MKKSDQPAKCIVELPDGKPIDLTKEGAGADVVAALKSAISALENAAGRAKVGRRDSAEALLAVLAFAGQEIEAAMPKFDRNGMAQRLKALVAAPQ